MGAVFSSRQSRKRPLASFGVSGNHLTPKRECSQQLQGWSALNEDSLISLLARLPLSCRDSVCAVCRRCRRLLLEDPRVSQHRLEIGFREETLLAALSKGMTCVLVDGRWRRCAPCPVEGSSEWDSEESVCVVRGSKRIAMYYAACNKWEVLPALPGVVRSCVAYRESVIALCVTSSGRLSTQLFDASTRHWVTLSEEDEARDFDVRTLSAAVDDVLVSFGARHAFCFDLRTRKWRAAKARIPDYRFDFGKVFAVGLAGRIYGFRLRENSFHGFELSRLWIYDPKLDQYETAPATNDGLSSGFLVPLRRKLLLVPLPHDRAHQSAWQLDVDTHVWKTLDRPLPRPCGLPSRPGCAISDFACLLPILI